MKLRTLVAAACFLALGFAGTVAAQTETNHLWPTFDVAIGSYQVTSSDKIEVDGSIERFGRQIDLDKEFGLGGSCFRVRRRLPLGVRREALGRPQYLRDQARRQPLHQP